MGEKSFLSNQQMRNLFQYHQKYNKLEYTFYQFVDFCKHYEVRRCDKVTVHVPYSFPAKLSDLRLHRMQKENGEYMLYDFMSFELLGVPKLSAEEREEALK